MVLEMKPVSNHSTAAQSVVLRPLATIQVQLVIHYELIIILKMLFKICT